MSGKSNSGAKSLPTRRRRLLALPVLALLVAAVAATTAFARGGAVTWPTEAQETATSGVFTNLPFCGTKQITLGIHDGFGINAWSQESYAAVRSEAAKCQNVKQIVVVGGGSLEKSISDVNSMVAQGVNAIVHHPRLRPGPARRRSSRPRRPASRSSVGRRSGRQAGQGLRLLRRLELADRGHHVGELDGQAARRQGQHRLPRRPGRQPGHPGQLKSIVKVFAKHPGMKLLTGKKTWPVTNWDPATAQKQMSALLAKYKKIDGIISDYGTDALAAMRAMQAANRKLVPIATLEANGLSCLYKKVHKSNPEFQLGDDLVAQLARPGGRPQGDRRGSGPPEQGAEHLRAAVLRELGQRPGPGLRAERGPRLRLVEQADAGTSSASTGSRRREMSEARVVLRLTDVVKTFPGVVALKGVGLEVVEGEVHALVGENGAGKSTLMAVAAGSTLPDTGSVEIGGQVMESPRPPRRRRWGWPSSTSTPRSSTTSRSRRRWSCVPRGRRPRCCARAVGAPSSSRWSAPAHRPRRRVERAERRRSPARRDRQGAGARAEGAGARRADRGAHARRERAAVRAGRARSRPRARRSSTSPTASPRCGASPTASPSCATARRAARSAAASVSEAEILRADHRALRRRPSRPRPSSARRRAAA